MNITVNGLSKEHAQLAMNMGAEVHEHLDEMYSAEFSGWVLSCTPNTIALFKDIFSERIMFGRSEFTSTEIV